jgi:hypothetical protein
VTAYLVLFCNVVATSDIGDFNLMKAIVDCLAQSGVSYPLVRLQTLFQRFLRLSQDFFDDERRAMQGTYTDSGSYSSLSYPMDNPFPVFWNADNCAVNQLTADWSRELF